MNDKKKKIYKEIYKEFWGDVEAKAGETVSAKYLEFDLPNIPLPKNVEMLKHGIYLDTIENEIIVFDENCNVTRFKLPKMGNL